MPSLVVGVPILNHLQWLDLSTIVDRPRIIATRRFFPRFWLSLFDGFQEDAPPDPGSGSLGDTGTRAMAGQPGSDELAAQLTERYWNRLKLFAARRLRDASAAEDVAQETMRRALEALRKGEIEHLVALPAFLFRTAENMCMHRGRSRAREARALGRISQGWKDMSPSEPTDALAGLIGEERRAQVREALGRLAEHDRQLLRMAYVELMKADEIAHALGINSAAFRARKHRALQRLAACLRPGFTGHAAAPEET